MSRLPASQPDRLLSEGGARPVVGRWYGLALIALLVIEQVAFGANGPQLGLLFAAVHSALLLLLLGQPWGRRALLHGELIVPAILFTGVVAAALVSLTPLGGAPNASIWGAVGAPPSAAINRQALVIEVLKLIGLGFLFLAAFACGRDRSRTWEMIRAVVIFGGGFGILSLLLHFVSPSTLFGYRIRTGPDRLAATLGSADVAGTFFGVLLLCALAALSQQWKDTGRQSEILVRQLDLFLRRTPLELGALLLSASCLVLTASRSALAATAVSVLLLLFLEGVGGGLRSKRWFVPLVTVVTIAAVVGFGGDMVANRYLQSAHDAASRLTIVQAHWRAVQASPWLGSGLGSFADLNRMLADKGNAADLISIGATHDVYLQWLEQTGIVGAGAMFCCVGFLLLRIAAALLKRLRLSIVLRLSLAASVLILAHGVTDFSLEVPSVAALWTVLLGLAVGRAA